MSEHFLPKNMSFNWGIGSKSFASIFSHDHGKGNQRQDEWSEAQPHQQLSEDVMALLFHKAIDLANQSPKRDILYTRYDIEGTPETENNRPFRDGGEVKYMTYEGYRYKGKL